MKNQTLYLLMIFPDLTPYWNDFNWTEFITKWWRANFSNHCTTTFRNTLVMNDPVFILVSSFNRILVISRDVKDSYHRLKTFEPSLYVRVLPHFFLFYPVRLNLKTPKTLMRESCAYSQKRDSHLDARVVEGS